MTGKTNTEKGKVIKAENGKVVVQFERTSACGHCDHKESCNSGDGSYMFLELDNTINAKAGETVEISSTKKNIYKNGFVVYILPLIILLTFAGFGNYFDTRLETGFMTPLLSVFSLVVYFLCLGIIYKNKESELELSRPGRKNIGGCSHCG